MNETVTSYETADSPLAGLRAGALAATEGLMLSPVTAENLGARVRPLPDHTHPADDAAPEAEQHAAAAAPDAPAAPGTDHRWALVSRHVQICVRRPFAVPFDGLSRHLPDAGLRYR